jgi:hypothetical protein
VERIYVPGEATVKAIVVHNDAKQIEKDWAKQYAGLDAAVTAQFAGGLADWGFRVQRVFTIPTLTWKSIVKTVSDAAQAAGQNGIVILASGHGGSVDADAGIINWDATEPPGGTHARDWKAGKVGKGLFWDEPVSKYTDPIPNGTPPTLKEEDEDKIRRKVPGWQILQQRHDAFEALEAIGNALQQSKVKRLAFTVCNAGASTNFMKRLAKHCHSQVACFKLLTKVLDDGAFGYTPGKARLVLDRDSTRDGQGTNSPRARVFSPDLDDPTIAFVASAP